MAGGVTWDAGVDGTPTNESSTGMDDRLDV